MPTVFEGGYNAGKKFNELEKDPNGGLATEDLGNAKFPVAQVWAMGESFGQGPELRFYGTYLLDTEIDKALGDDDTGFEVGIKVKAWWKSTHLFLKSIVHNSNSR